MLPSVRKASAGAASVAGVALLSLVVIAAGACSARSPDSTNASSAVTPSPPAFGTLLLWLAADQGVTQSAGLVSQWNDQSGNGNNVSQSVLASQPEYHASGAGPGASRPYLTFGRVETNTFSPHVFLDNTLSNLAANGSDVTIVVAASVPLGGSGGTLLTLQRTAPLATFEYVDSYLADYAYSDGINTSSNDNIGPPPLPVTGPLLLDFTYHQGTSVVLSLDGTALHNTGTATSYTGATGFTVGDREDNDYLPWLGDIYEILVYQGVLSGSNLTGARQYLASKWGLPLSSGTLDAGACPAGLTLCGGTCVPWQDGAPCTAAAVPASWTTPAWYIDPANSTGKASDSNACTSATKPCLTYARVSGLWGTNAPELNQNTTITFLSSQPDNSDPVYFNPYVERAARVTLQGALGTAQQVAAGTLSNVVAKSQANGQLWRATLPPGVAPGQLVVNTTRTSRAWIYKSAGGSDWLLSQPMTPSNLSNVLPPETDNWANDDAVVVYTPVRVDLAQVAPVVAGGNYTEQDFFLNVYQLTVGDGALDASAPVQDDFQIGNSVGLVESSVRKTLNVGAGSTEWDNSFANDDFTQSISTTTGPVAAIFWGGQTRYGGGQSASINGAQVDGDIVASGEWDLYGGNVYAAFVDTGASLVARTGLVAIVSLNGTSAPQIWGPGSVDVVGNARLEYPPTSTASAVFLEKGGLFLNADPSLIEGATVPGSTTACSVGPTGSWTCGIPLTPANLDATLAAGGFAGLATVPGGASVTNVGTLDGMQ